eukprot:TRINITY_DN90411_c0_g1_i1.p1 TRINITY_DN90411_c0_g1~~TRINITY_DN90411_c0_g1_i1.p1  ORF type:complete len:135 (+),score=24.99 TRINITY_DN90411_c0_g1_i1:16-420(+)
MSQSAWPLKGVTVLKGDLKGDVTDGGAYVLEFWATWCPPCVRSIPHVTELAKKYPNITFIGVTNEPVSRAKPFVDRMGEKMDYVVVADETQITNVYAEELNIEGIPHAVIINKGVIVHQSHPMDPSFEEALQKI